MPKNVETCCICLENCIFFQNINECHNGITKYIDKLKTCLPNESWHEEFNICNYCVEKLNAAYEFVQVCLKGEQYRKETLRLKDQLKQEDSTDFTCQECSKSFRLKRTLNLHITRIHLNPKKNLKKRLKRKELSGTDVKDETSDIKDISKVEIEKLDTEIMIKEIQEASDCEYGEGDEHASNYSSDEEMLKVKKTGKKRGPKKRKEPLKCEYCGVIFTRSDKYTQHVRSKHTFEKPFKCNLCDAKYYTSHNLIIHKRKHTNEKPYVCSTCGKSFISSNDLWQHSKIHNDFREYGCNECDRSFKTHSNLRTHKLQMHQDPGQWKFVCTVCGKKFPLNNNLIKHMRRHEGIKQFACHLCEKKFVEKIDMQTHLLSHSNQRLFKCEWCEKEYKKKETLRRHLKIEHNIGNMKIRKPEKKLVCPMCPKIFAFNNKLQRHILTHTGEKPVKCDYCEKRFRDNYDRNVHLRKDHNIEPPKSY